MKYSKLSSKQSGLMLKQMLLIAAISLIAIPYASAGENNTSKTNEAPAPEAAIVIRTIKDVKYKDGASAAIEAKRGQSLSSGNTLITGEKSLAILSFLDKTTVRIQENSKLVVLAEKDASGKLANKEVSLDFGKLGFDVKSRPGETFRFKSPTSVASIKGTVGGYSVESDGTTNFTITEGSATVTTKDGKTYEVNAGQTVYYNASSGQSGVRQATTDDRQTAGITNGTGKVTIKFKDKQGNEKAIEVDPTKK